MDGTGRSFNFLGFTHYLGKNRKGNKVLKLKTSSKRLTKAIMNISKFIKLNCHMILLDLIAEINVKLRGHYLYYGIAFNSKGIICYFVQVSRSLLKWLNRRGEKRIWNCKTFSLLLINRSLLRNP